MDVNSLFPFFNSSEKYPITFQYDNCTLEVETKKEWQIVTKESVFIPYLINKSLIILKVKGRLTPKFVSHMGEKISLILCFQGVSKFIAVSDFSNVVSIGLGSLFDLPPLFASNLNNIRAHEYIIPYERIRPVFFLHRVILKLFRKKTTTLVPSIEEGIRQALVHLPKFNHKIKEEVTTTSGSNLQSLRIKQLINAINDLSWGQELDAKKYNIPENDPFKDLFSAFHGLQKEVKHVLNKTASLNQALEKLVTERTQRLLKQSRRLQKLNEQLDRYIYSASHELRAPVVSMLGLLELLELDHDSNEKQVYIDLLRDTINKQDNVLKQIIQIRENNKSVPKKHKIDLDNLLQEVISDLGFNKDGINVDLKVTVTQPTPYYTDKYRLKTIVHNLLKNSYQYSENKKIRLNAIIKKKQLKLIIQDYGEGIDSEALPYIFDIFYRASEEKSGVGLGLFMVNEIVNSLSGNIEVESTRNVGTKFIITLPTMASKAIPSVSDSELVEKILLTESA